MIKIYSSIMKFVDSILILNSSLNQKTKEIELKGKTLVSVINLSEKTFELVFPAERIQFCWRIIEFDDKTQQDIYFIKNNITTVFIDCLLDQERSKIYYFLFKENVYPTEYFPKIFQRELKEIWPDLRTITYQFTNFINDLTLEFL